MTDLVQRLRDLKEWAEEREIPTLAKAGATAIAVGEAILTGAVLITPEMREIVKEMGVPTYIGSLAVINALGTLFYLGETVPRYHGNGNKTNDNNSYAHP